MKARFIVLEGIDGAGTTTQTARLAAALRARGRTVHATREPSDGPTGRLLREMLTGRVAIRAHTQTERFAQLGLLFAADRLDHLGVEVLPRLLQGEWVISDRYDHSSVAYQSLGGTTPIAWLRELNRFARRPDLTIVLDVSPEVARVRRLARAGPQELFDDDALQRALASFYLGLEQHFPGEPIAHVSAEAGMDEVGEAVLAQVLPLLD